MEYDRFTSFTDAKDTGDRGILTEVLTKKDLFVVPGVLPDAGVFPNARPRVVHQGRERTLAELESSPDRPMTALGSAYLAALNASLAIQTRESLMRCGTRPGDTILVEGGFARNTLYCELLTALCPQNAVALTTMTEGTSMGAAIIGWMMVTGEDLSAMGRRFTVETREIKPERIPGLEEYAAAFMDAVQA